MVVIIPIPKEFIGKWCAVEQYGTHGSYDILWDNMIFESEEQGELYVANRFRFQEKHDYRIVKITESYPVWQTYINQCGSSVEHLKQNFK